ncbi:MAG: energy-coupling factor ABC transporter substrate-binding protein [Austwickia sp.]|nr:energy-coupling factor ABC transporter substrate-binding protein [Austwickia sp.]MBK8437872.1 energy-coupling factor ABC transporter substrate-binding protein [Austwickia sp.]MBK9100173.1 energy-coupling factor ABC transporter substrate-binding protein [Austwickia sp.]
MTRRWIDALLLVAVLAVLALALVLGSGRPTSDGEAFGGSDAAVTAQLEADGYRPWFAPLFSPGSAEIESGLFAVQAALGGGLLGYCLGALRRRTRARSSSLETAAEVS